MKEILKELREDILTEENNIEETIKRLVEIKKEFQGVQKDYRTEPAMGTYLMNFYNGIEHILKRICKVYFRTFPTGANWHKELLDLSYSPPLGKFPVFSKQVVSQLYQYKDFRHRFVSGYGFQLKGEKMISLIDELDPLWEKIKRELEEFLKKLQIK